MVEALMALKHECSGPLLDVLAIVLPAARICQTLVHVVWETNFTVSVRFGFFFVQMGCMFAMGGIVAVAA